MTKQRTINLGDIYDASIFSDKEPGTGLVEIESEKYKIRFEISHNNVQCFAHELWRFIEREQASVDRMKSALTSERGG